MIKALVELRAWLVKHDISPDDVVVTLTGSNGRTGARILDTLRREMPPNVIAEQDFRADPRDAKLVGFKLQIR